VGPFRPFEAEAHSPGQGFKAFHKSGQGNGTDLPLPDLDRPGGEIFLAQGVKMDVGGKARPQTGSKRKQPARQIHGNPVDKNPGKLVELKILIGDEQQRVEKMLAELPVGHPRSQPEFLEGQRIDENRLPVNKLDVEGAGVLEGHPKIKGLFLDFKCGQSRLFELREAPLIRIGDEGYDLGPDDFIGRLRVGGRDVGLLMADKEALLRQRFVEPARKEQVIIVLIGPVDLSVKCALALE